jgi:hypothetical protein
MGCSLFANWFSIVRDGDVGVFGWLVTIVKQTPLFGNDYRHFLLYRGLLSRLIFLCRLLLLLIEFGLVRLLLFLIINSNDFILLVGHWDHLCFFYLGAAFRLVLYNVNPLNDFTLFIFVRVVK